MTSYLIQNFPILSLTAFLAFLCFFLLVEKSDVHSIKKKIRETLLENMSVFIKSKFIKLKGVTS